jgi:hypothetical protein
VLHIISILERHVMAINSEEEEIITLEGVWGQKANIWNL